jgi:hypothetical protein
MESEILRTATLGKGTAATTGQGHPPGVVSRYLDAAFQASPQAQGALHKLRGFVRFLRATYGEVFARTHAISKAIQKGDIKEGEHHAMLAKLLGTSDTVQADAHAVAVATEIIDGTERTTFADGSTMDTPFSIGKGGPDSQTLESRISRAAAAKPLVISTAEWAGLSANQRGAKAKELARKLQDEIKAGNPITNADRNKEIKVSIEGVKHWSHYAEDPRKAALLGKLRELLTSAVFLRSEIPDPRKAPDGNIKGFQRLALPFVADGQELVVIVTLRNDTNGDWVYDGKVFEIETPADVSKTSREPTGGKPEGTPPVQRARVEAITHALEHNKNLTRDDAFSISHNRQLDVLTRKSLALANDPAFRTAMMRRVAGNLGKLRSIPGRIKTAFGMDYKERAISDERAMKSLKKEAAFREAAARAEYEDAAKAKHEGILENPDLAKLKEQPVHEWLSIQGDRLHGRLMSPSAAIARGTNFFDATKHGDFDGADGVSRTLFGGTLMPDQAAQELYDHHLIKEPTPDAMWDALKAEGKSVAKFKQYQQAAQADIRKGRLQAAEEARAWLDAAINALRRTAMRNAATVMSAIRAKVTCHRFPR